MSYVDYDFYKSRFAGEATEAEFNRYLWDAELYIDKATTGADGIKKLMVAFPADEYSAVAVKRCACELLELIRSVGMFAKNLEKATGLVDGGNGLRKNMISSVSAGTESVSYATNQVESVVSKLASADFKERSRAYTELVSERLSGIFDANGVNLLYMGKYPARYSL